MSPAALVVFGITGDLARRKLLPALYHLTHEGLLPEQTRIVGVTRSGTTVSVLIEHIRQAVNDQGHHCDTKILQRLEQMLHVVTMDITDIAAYRQLKSDLATLDTSAGTRLHRLFYLAIPSQIFLPVVDLLGQAGLNTRRDRLLIEKPFGFDLESARDLVTRLNQSFDESQIYRIDHYLAKEVAQSLLTFRFRNPLFRTIWNGQHIKSILVTTLETLDVEGRAVFYEQTGALRDLVQNHLLQLLTLTTMEEPRNPTPDSLHRGKLALLKDIQPIAPNQVATQATRGQYRGYRTEVNRPDSWVETYAELQLSIANDRWAGVPITLRTGKALAEKSTQIQLTFADDANPDQQNILTLHLQPLQEITLQLHVKRPGHVAATQTVDLQFDFGSLGQRQGDAYERVLLDAFCGDKTLFVTSDQVLRSWEIMQAVVEQWAKDGNNLHIYPKGSRVKL